MAFTSQDQNAHTFFIDTIDSDESDSDYASDAESLIRSDSSSSSCPETPWIIEHVLQQRIATKELPLRVMFSFNSGQGLPNLKDVHQLWQFERHGKKIMTFLSSTAESSSPIASDTSTVAMYPRTQPDYRDESLHSPYDKFMDEGLEEFWEPEVIQNPSPTRRASQGLPPKFVEKMILSTIFHQNLEEVDFKQALAGLDYLRDIEETRRCHLREAADRLKITADNWRVVLGENIRALEWIEDVLDQETTIEAHYRKVFVSLRIWTMLYELKHADFYKPNVLAMLNTLFPPKIDDSDCMPVKAHVIHQHRARLYHCMIEVEHQADFRRSQLVDGFVGRYMVAGTGYSWADTRACLEEYMKLAEVMIRQAKLVRGIDFFIRHNITESQQIDSPTLFTRDIKLTTLGEENLSKVTFDPQSSLPRLSFRDPPQRNPLRPKAGAQEPQFSRAQCNARPRFRARSHSDSTMLPPRQIREASTDLGALLTIPTTDLQQMILAAIRAVTPTVAERDFKDCTSPHDNFNAIRERSGMDKKVTSEVKLRARLDSISNATDDSTRTDVLEMASVKHRRTNAAVLPNFMSHRKRASSNLRLPGVRRDSSSLRNVDSTEADEVEAFMRGHTSKLSISSQRSPRFVTPLTVEQQREREAEAYVQAKFPSFDHHRIPPLQPVLPPHRPRKDSLLGERSWSRNTSFATEPLSTMSENNRREDYWPSPTAVSSTFGNERSDLTRINSKVNEYASSYSLLSKTHTQSTRMEQAPATIPKKQKSFVLDSRPSFASERGGDQTGYIQHSPIVERATTSMGFRQDAKYFDNSQDHTRQPLKKQSSFNFLSLKKTKKTPEPLKLSKPNEILPPVSPSKRPPLSPYHPNAVKNRREFRGQISSPSMGVSSPGMLPRESIETTRISTEGLLISRPYTPATEYDSSFPSPQQITTREDPRDSEKKLNKAKSANSLRSLFRKKSKEVVLTSEDIEEPFPTHLRESLTKHNNGSLPDLRSPLDKQNDREREENKQSGWLVNGDGERLTDRYTPISDESYEEFQRKEYARRWFLEEAKAKKRNQSFTGSRPSWESDLELLEGQVDTRVKKGGVKRAFGKKIGDIKIVKKTGTDTRGVDYDDLFHANRRENKRPGVVKKASNGFLGMGFGGRRREEGALF